MYSTVFLSFSSSDSSLALSISEGLKKRNIKVWKAPESISPGEDWASAIDSAIKANSVFLLLWSDASMASSEVTKEITLAAMQKTIIFIPIRLTHHFPTGAQAYHLAGTQWIEGKDKSVDTLVEEIEVRLTSVPANTYQQVSDSSVLTQTSTTSRIRSRLIILSTIGIMAFGADLFPWSPPQQWMLNQRLFWQARWRQVTSQPGPSPPVIGVMPLSKPLYKELELSPNDQSVNQAALAKVLKLVPSRSTKNVGLDFILDGQGENSVGHTDLADTIKKQSDIRTIFAGICSPNASANDDCLNALDQELSNDLLMSGAVQVTLGLGQPPGSHPPLHLSEAIGNGSFAMAMATTAPSGPLPDNAIIDWSINWLSPNTLKVVRSLDDLKEFTGKSLIVSNNGYKGVKFDNESDLHQMPQAVLAYSNDERIPLSSLQKSKLPGGVVQGVYAQSISSGHWLTLVMPLANTIVSSAMALLALGLTRLGPRRRWFVIALPLSLCIYILISFQLAVSTQRILPIVMPISMGLAIIGLSGRKALKR